MGLDNCYTCLVMDLEANEAANSVLTGGSSSGVSDSTAASIKADGERLHTQYVNQCAAAGYPLSASSGTGTVGGGAGSSSGASGGSTSSGGTAVSGTSGNSATKRGINLGGGLAFVVGVAAAFA
ncbi:hypothetical protein NMY22_g9964 [Coprinellus aureogranulatus]|nr:hypothetical protein NMY22_g9964 [Coprinellus aureogranulatus]